MKPLAIPLCHQKTVVKVIGYGYSHSTWLPKDGNQVAGYRLLAEKLLAGHPKGFA
jgi:hypothetical protein